MMSLLENLETRTLLSIEPVMATVVGTTFPGAATAGQALSGKFSLVLQSLESTPEAKGGRVQVLLQAENMGTGMYTELAPQKLVKLPALAVGGTTKLSLTVKLAEGLAAGDYEYFAEISPPPGVMTNPIDFAGGPNTKPRTLSLHVADAVYGVTGAMVSSTLQNSNTGVSGKVGLTIENEGNVAWARGQQLQVEIVANGVASEGETPGDWVLGTQTVTVKKGSVGAVNKLTIPVKYTQALGGGEYTVGVQVTPLGALASSGMRVNSFETTAGGGTLTLLSKNAAHLTPVPPPQVVDESGGSTESASGTVTVSGSVSNGGIIYAGANGTLGLSGNNTYSGTGSLLIGNLTLSSPESDANSTLGNTTVTLSNATSGDVTTTFGGNGTITVSPTLGNTTLTLGNGTLSTGPILGNGDTAGTFTITWDASDLANPGPPLSQSQMEGFLETGMGLGFTVGSHFYLILSAGTGGAGTLTIVGGGSSSFSSVVVAAESMTFTLVPAPG